ncbi:MAG: hypothetical protein NVS9B14_20230 [Candidatus Acidiferrum sp.]
MGSKLASRCAQAGEGAQCCQSKDFGWELRKRLTAKVYPNSRIAILSGGFGEKTFRIGPPLIRVEDARANLWIEWISLRD